MSSPQFTAKKSWFHNALPALTLMVMAPAVAELMAGATRLSSAYVFPIEMLIWGSGAVLARFVVRKYRLGWFNLVLLALALAMAEELLIQQTSFAPLVVQIQHQEYGRALGFNYVYFVWAMLYEAILVVCVPVAVTEMMFPSRRDNGWLNIWGIIPLIVLFVPASFMAWYGWNIIARHTVFHLEPYRLPQNLAIVSAVVIGAIILLAAGPARRLLARPAKPAVPPHPLVIAALSVVAMAVIFAIEVLAFGIAPQVPPAIPVVAGVITGALALWLVPAWQASAKWTTWHSIALTFGAAWGTWGLLFMGFGGGIDLYGKIGLDVAGVLVLIWIAAFRLGKTDAGA
ncbi:MAG: hypothetical protein ACXU8O_00450 [Asticcacaulis sp.]